MRQNEPRGIFSEEKGRKAHMSKIKVIHYRFRDTGKTADLSWQGKGVVSVFALEVQKSKDRWEQLKDDGPQFGYGQEQAIANLRFLIHWRLHPVHAYQIDGIDSEPLIAVPIGYAMKRLVVKGSVSYHPPDYYLPYALGAPSCEEGAFHHEQDGSTKVFKRYLEALSFLRKAAGEQIYAYDGCTFTW